jgi:acyl-CoA synthetase (AMP-forming)/AMP-acid ligase II
MPKVSILSTLRERASLQPNDPAFTFTDFEQDWAGVTDRLMWVQAYRRSLNVAIELANQFARLDV